MSMPTVLVEMFMGGSWVDVSTGTSTAAYLDRAAAPLTITRGRENEQSDITPGVCTFSLVNDDGRFTLGNTSGAYSPHFKKWIPVRVNINGLREFYGYLSQAETTWDDDTGLHAHTAVTCTDLLGMMAMSPNVSSWADALIAAMSPVSWWKLNDAPGATTAAASAGGDDFTISSTAGTSGLTISDLLEFGAEGPASLEADTMVSFTPKLDATTGLYDTAQLLATLAATGFPATVFAIHTRPVDEVGFGKSPIWTVQSTGGSFTLFRMVGSGDLVADVRRTTTHYTATIPNYFRVGVPTLTAVVVTSSTLTLLGGSVSVSGYAADANIFSGFSTIIVGSGDNTVSPGTWPGTGATGHVAILPGEMTEATFSDLKSKMVGDGAGSVLDWVDRAASEAGYSSVATATYNRTMERPTLKGSNPAAVGSALGNAAGSVFAITKAGDPKWYDFTYCPTRIDIASGEWERQSAWAPDQSLYYSEVQFDGVVAGTVAGAFPRKALDVQPLLPAAEQTAYTTYLVNAQDVITGPRLSQIGIDLATVATPATYQAIDIRSRIALAAVPTQIPAGAVMTVEGYTHSVSDIGWYLTLTTAPDPRFVIGDSVAGVIGSNYRISPF